MTTPKLQLPETANGQANYLLVNSALAALDQLVMPRVVDKDLSTPPGSPSNGAMYIVGGSPTGAWAGKAGNLAWWLTAVGAWTFLAPAAGMSVRVLDELDSSGLPVVYSYNGSAWVQQPGGGMTNPMTTAGDMIIGGVSGSPTRLAAGTDGYVMTMASGFPVWQAPSGGGFTGGTLTSALNEAPLTTLASASTTNIGAEAANTINISGTTTITSFGTIASGAVRRLVFQGALTLTHNATSLILPTGANITTAAGDSAEFVSLGSGNWRCTDYLRASGEPLAGGGGGSGLTHLTEAKNTSAPNATVPVVSLSVTITETNGDVAFVPKGTGALMAAMPTGTASGGNKRGTHATDWQTNRSSATQVASGNYACITGGQQCTASGSHAVAGGYFAEASGAQSIAIGGQSASATAQYATAIGGNGPLANQQYATAIGGNGVTVTGSSATGVGGESNIIDGPLSSVCGGARATTRGVYGVEARAAGRFSANGDAQRERFVLRRATTDATPAVLSADGGSPAAATQVTLPNNAAYGFTGRLVARASASGDCASWEFKGTIRRGANAAATALVSAVSPTLVAGDAGAAGWTVSVTADTALGCLSITATGAAATNIKWVADVETVEVVG
ncbi:DUF2793 domain-containing protein [Pseudomonas sp. SP16.1]|uniref:DUF2793 domain-containing protein n=1 Tax=Pseudomonas sp. SP16.1 TaxID=3458854 RepID=UPI004045480C